MGDIQAKICRRPGSHWEGLGSTVQAVASKNLDSETKGSLEECREKKEKMSRKVDWTSYKVDGAR